VTIHLHDLHFDFVQRTVKVCCSAATFIYVAPPLSSLIKLSLQVHSSSSEVEHITMSAKVARIVKMSIVSADKVTVLKVALPISCALPLFTISSHSTNNDVQPRMFG